MRRHVPLLAACFALTVLASACSGAWKSSVTPTPAPFTGAPLTANEFCAGWAQAAAKEPALAIGPRGAPSQVKASADDTLALVWSLADRTPLDVRPWFAGYALAWNDYHAALASGAFDVARIAADPALKGALQDAVDQMPRYGNRVNAWARANCVQPLTVGTAMRLSLLGASAQVFTPNTPESTVQAYVQAVLERDLPRTLAQLAPRAVARCKDDTREAFARQQEAAEVTAVLDRIERAEGFGVVHVAVTEPGPGTSTRQLAFLVRSTIDGWRIISPPWPAVCPVGRRPWAQFAP
jgi:hypothetical protein